MSMKSSWSLWHKIKRDVAKQAVVREVTGDADIDVSESAYETGYVNMLTVTAPSTGLLDCTIDIDFDKDTTGWNDVATHGDVLDCSLVKQTDGTNYRSVQDASAQITSAATLTATNSGVTFKVGPMQANESVQVQVKMNTERGDSEQPYRVTSVGDAPTVTAVAAV